MPGIVGDIAKLAAKIGPREAGAEVVPVDEPSKKLVGDLASGKMGKTAKKTFDTADALSDIVEVQSGGPQWADYAKKRNVSTDFLDQSNVLGIYTQKPIRRGENGNPVYKISLNPSLEKYEQQKLIPGGAAQTLGHELGHFLIEQSGVRDVVFPIHKSPDNPRGLVTNLEAMADFMGGYSVEDRNTEAAKVIMKQISELIARQSFPDFESAAAIGARTGARAARLLKPSR